jgi:hypothetical protein
MNPIDLKPTRNTPAINFNADTLSIKGRSIPLSDAGFYDPYIAWAEEVSCKNLTVEINLEYMNSSSSKKLLHLLKKLDSNRKIISLIINWFYEEGDEEILEHGKVFEKLLKNARFRFQTLS